MRQDHAPVDVHRAVTGIGDGGCAHGQEHRVEEGERADGHLGGVSVF
jgi:hypothetical protein